MSQAGLGFEHEMTVFRSADDDAEVTMSGGHTDTWTENASDVLCRVEKITPARSQQIFGRDSRASYVGFVDRGADVEPGDTVKLTAGDYAVRYLDVVDFFIIPSTGVKQLELADTKARPDEV